MILVSIILHARVFLTVQCMNTIRFVLRGAHGTLTINSHLSNGQRTERHELYCRIRMTNQCCFLLLLCAHQTRYK